MQKKAERSNGHLAVVFSRTTGLFHGAVYANNPTPSGCDRFLLVKSTKEGFLSPRDAARAINVFGRKLEIELLDPEEFEDIPPPPDLSKLPKGLILTLVTPHAKSEPSYVEAEHEGQFEKTILHPTHLSYLFAQGKIQLELSSGYDPDLSATYDYYVIV